MAEKVYRIRKLKWTFRPRDESEDAWHDFEEWKDEHSRGGYWVKRAADGRVSWGYCYDEYYDEGNCLADNVRQAKAAAVAHYEARVKEALEEVSL